MKSADCEDRNGGMARPWQECSLSMSVVVGRCIDEDVAMIAQRICYTWQGSREAEFIIKSRCPHEQIGR